MEIGIIADDLTGAADAVAAFAQRGYRANVGFKARPSGELFPLMEGDALAYDTNTRDMPSDQEHALEQIVRQAARQLAELQPRLIFKKIDSTLRGHLRLELEAVRQEFPNRLAIVCPAFPAQGRTVQTGVLHIHNAPWTSTEFAPPSGAKYLTVRGAFGMEEETEARPVTSEMIRQGVDGLETRLQAWRQQGVHTVFYDAEHEEALDILAQTIFRQPQTYLPVGSAGLAQAVATTLPLRPLAAPVDVTLFYKGRVLVVVGSLHTASRRQLLRLLERLQAIPVVVQQTSSYNTKNIRTELEQAGNNVCGQYAAGKRVVMLTTPAMPDADNRHDFAPLLAGVAERVCLRQRQIGQAVEAIAVCGGDTAIALCQMLGGTGLHITGQREPGMVTSRLIASLAIRNDVCFDGLPIATKAGG